MDGPVRREGVYTFEGFELDPVSRALTRDGTPVKLAARLFDTLVYLVENQGRLVTRDELMRAVWPARTVEETSLAMAISSLRTALKQAGAPESLIVTAPGRGYRFGARVIFTPVEAAPVTMAHASVAEGIATPGEPVPRAQRWKFALAALMLVAATGVVYLRPRPGGTAPQEVKFAPPPHSIAVLPFTNASGDPHVDYFADGLSGELINALGRSDGLSVAARMSSFSFRGRAVTIGDIARQLNVGLVLEGSVERDGSRIRIMAELIDARTGFQVWAHRFDGALGDIMTLQAQLAETVSTSLQVVLLPNDVARLTLGGTTDGRAFDAYLSGLPNTNDGDEAQERAAIAAFNTAIQIDPNYALAYSERARAASFLATNGTFADLADSRRLLDKALHDAEQAVALAPELAEAHAALAFVLKCQLSELGRAGAEYTRAVELAPGDATILMRYALFELILGHVSQAVAAAEHAAALDPLTPRTYRNLSRVLAYARRFDDAKAALRRAQSLQPADPAADRQALELVEMWQGDAAAARDTSSVAKGPYDYLCLAVADHALGRQAEAEAALAKLQQSGGDNAAYLYAVIYAAWGQREQAVQWLQTAYRLRDAGLIEIQVNPKLQLVRDTPAYRTIVAGLGFPP